MTEGRAALLQEAADQLRKAISAADDLDNALAVHGLPPIDRHDDAIIVIFRTLVQILNMLPERTVAKH
jgi:hypothetical protein